MPLAFFYIGCRRGLGEGCGVPVCETIRDVHYERTLGTVTWKLDMKNSLIAGCLVRKGKREVGNEKSLLLILA